MNENEKQAIEEMDKDIGEALMHNSVVDIINGGFIGVNSEGMARELFDDGYRKQSNSVWSTSVIFDVPAQKIVNYGHVCQSCFYSCKSKSPHGHKFCPNCGAHMKGGVE